LVINNTNKGKNSKEGGCCKWKNVKFSMGVNFI
jgi:hypothetical protein